MTAPRERARQRENPEPEEGDRPVPKAVFVLIAGLFLWGCYYLLAHTGYPLGAGDARTPIVARDGADGGAVSGASVYAGNCAACHQAKGQGMAGTFPPLVGSRWVTEGNGRMAAAIVLRGLQGGIEVQGTVYDGQMPSFAGQLSDAEIAAVVTHIRTSWGNDAGAVSAGVVSEVRTALDGDAGPWKGGEALRSAFDGSAGG